MLGEKVKLQGITQKHVEKWQAAAADSLFGNDAKQETQHDARGRSTRELDTTQFEVGPKFLDAITKQWKKEMVPKTVSRF